MGISKKATRGDKSAVGAVNRPLRMSRVVCYMHIMGRVLYLSSCPGVSQTFGENTCYPEPMRCAQGKLRAGSGSPNAKILRCAQDDSQDTRSRPFLEYFLNFLQEIQNVC